MFSPSFLNIYGDEGDSLTIRHIYNKTQTCLQNLNDSIMKVGKLKFKFNIFFQADGKLRVKCMSTAGPSHLYSCVQCFSTTPEDIGMPRTVAEATKLATRAAWNPDSEDDLYHISKGCKEEPLAPFLGGTFVLDDLHMMLNMKINYEKAVILILAYCKTGDLKDPKDLLNPGRMSTQEVNMARISLAGHLRTTLGLSGRVEEKAVSPGNVAREWLNPSVFEKISEILPECYQKKMIRESIKKFDIVRSIMSKRTPTEEEKKSLKDKVIDWITHRKNNIKYITNTNIVHQIVTHAVNFLTEENHSVSLFDLSLSSLELKNKQLKNNIKHRSHKGYYKNSQMTASKQACYVALLNIKSVFILMKQLRATKESVVFVVLLVTTQQHVNWL